MELSNRMIYAVLGLVTLMLVGILLSSWRCSASSGGAFAAVIFPAVALGLVWSRAP